MGQVEDLLAKAAGAGLVVRVDGGRLIIRGVKQTEELARLLLSRKDEVMAILRGRGEQATTPAVRATWDDDPQLERSVLRVIERDQNLPTDSLTFWSPVRNCRCAFCTGTVN
jgi:hypothetical protein